MIVGIIDSVPPLDLPAGFQQRESWTSLAAMSNLRSWVNSFIVLLQKTYQLIKVPPRSIARNVLLLAMITDNEPSDDVLSKIWNSFFNFFLDEESHSSLIAQCQTLVEVSESITAWNDSKYSKFIRMCNVNTLSELRRHWERYVQAGQLSSTGKEQLKETVMSGIETTKNIRHEGSNLHPCRSAGPYFLKSTEPASQVFQHYWKTGVTSPNPQDVSAATLVNPTFAYSLTGEGFALHHGTTPIAPFHLAPAFLNGE